MTLVSIVTPSFNQAAFLKETIRSVLDQDYPHIEHIVVDGASTDGTLAILGRYPHLRWLSEPDGGQADALNKGFLLANGAILGWLNSDDLYLPGAVSAAVEALQTAAPALHTAGGAESPQMELRSTSKPRFISTTPNSSAYEISSRSRPRSSLARRSRRRAASTPATTSRSTTTFG